MKNKLTLAITSALYFGASAHAGVNTVNEPLSLSAAVIESAVKAQPKTHLPTIAGVDQTHQIVNQHQPWIEHADLQTYIITFVDEPVARYRGGITGLAATHKQMLAPINATATQKQQRYEQVAQGKQQRKQPTPSTETRYIEHPSVQAYKNYLDNSQRQFIAAAGKKLQRSLAPTFRYQLALNGLAIKLTSAEAKQLKAMPGIATIQREVLRSITTDTGPKHIGAPTLWQGLVNNTGVKGEGITVGILDTGVNTDHESFKVTGDDGFTHTKPNNTQFLGDCVAEASLCTDKLIGVFSYADVTDQYAGERPANGEDYNGHGSHTASTVAGNVLHNVPLLRPSSQETSDGLQLSDFSFDQISGVAPHANIVSFQVCLPGNPGDTLAGCYPSLAAKAVEDSIANDIDVINYSIGGGSSNPWEDADAQAFLSAREAGIVVITSAGNSGPNPETVGSPGDAPWITSVGAYSHGRSFSRDISGFEGGVNTPAAAITGLGQPGRIRTSDVVYAGNAPYNDPTCAQPLTTHRVSQKIVVCDRGDIALVEKAQNVFAGGGMAVIIANTDPENDGLFDLPYVIDGVHVDYAAGEVLRAWLSEGEGHRLTLDAGALGYDATQADQAANFTSRGPNRSVPDVIVPTVGAPGVSIYAAYADDQPFTRSPRTTDFNFLDGTSMASPHVAGAAALLRQLHPEWTVSDIHSTLSLTANSQHALKEDGSTPADAFDVGAGVIRVDLAAKAGLSLRESIDGFRLANPAEGGEPSQLNLASMAENQCVGQCEWTRTFTALKDGTYNVTVEGASNGLAVTVAPLSFGVVAGDTQQLTVNADVFDATNEAWSFANIVLTPTDSELPTLHLPLAAFTSLGNLPDKVTIKSSRNGDSHIIEDRQTVAIEAFTVRTYGVVAPTIIEGQIQGDSDPGNDLFDNLNDGVDQYFYTLNADTLRFITEIKASSAADIDIVLGRDVDENGAINLDKDKVLCVGANAHSLESCELRRPEAGKYWLVVNNHRASADNAIDTYTLAEATVTRNSPSAMTVATEQTQIDQLTPFDIRVAYNHEAVVGDTLYGAFDVGTNANNPGRIGMVAVDVERIAEDVHFSALNNEVTSGDTRSVSLNISKNFGNVDRNYSIDVTIPDGLTLVAESLPEHVVVSDNGFSLSQSMLAQAGQSANYRRVTNVEDPSCALPELGQGGGYIDLASMGVFPDPDLGSGRAASEVFTYFPNDTFHFFGGERKRGMGVSEDGYVFFNSGVDSFSFANQALPDPIQPNDLISPLWRDLVYQHNIDPANGDIVGVTVARVTENTGTEWAMVEWDKGTGFFDQGGFSNFELLMRFQRDLTPNAYEIIIAYDEMITNPNAFFTGTTVGIENEDASWGDTFVYKGFSFGGPPPIGDVATLQQGLVVCYDVNAAFFLPETIAFDVVVNDGFAGSVQTITAAHAVDLADTHTEEAHAHFAIAKNINMPQLAPVDMQEDQVSPVINVAIADRDDIANMVTATSQTGKLTVSNIVMNSDGASFTLTPEANFNGLDIINITVTDSEVATDTITQQLLVNVLPVNDAPSISAIANLASIEGAANVILTASTADIDSSNLSVTWAQVSGPDASFDTLSGDSVTVSIPAVSTTEIAEFEATVTDDQGATATTQVTVNLRAERVVKPVVNDAGGSSGSLWILLCLLPGFAMARRKVHH